MSCDQTVTGQSVEQEMMMSNKIITVRYCLDCGAFLPNKFPSKLDFLFVTRSLFTYIFSDMFASMAAADNVRLICKLFSRLVV